MEYEIMGKRRIIRKGGSATVTVPAKVMRYLGNPDDSVYFIRKGNDIVLRNVKFEEELIDTEQVFAGYSLKLHRQPPIPETSLLQS